MNKASKIVLPVLLLLFGVGQAGANYQAYWAVDWAAGTRTISYKLLNIDASIRTAGISGAIGREAGSLAGITTAGQFAEFAPVFCVDLRQYAADNFASGYQVDVHTGADGTAGWVTPSGDGDELRSEAGLGRAAALAGRFGTSWAHPASVLAGVDATDRNDRAIALNVAIWQAAYGSNFVYVGGMSAAQKNYYDNHYLPYYQSGVSTGNYRWWDSRALDAPSHEQDFLQGQVPEPGSLILLGTSLAVGSVLRAARRRRRAA